MKFSFIFVFHQTDNSESHKVQTQSKSKPITNNKWLKKIEKNKNKRETRPSIKLS